MRLNDRSRRVLPWLLLAAALIVTAVVYWPGLTGGWVFDDFPNIVDNAAIHITRATSNLGTWVSAALSSPSSSLHRPLASLTFAANWYFTGGNPWPMKLTNLLIHLLNGVLLFCMLRELLRVWNARREGRLHAGSYDRSNGEHGRLHAGSYDCGGIDDVAATRLALAVTAGWLLLPINLLAVLYVVQRMESLCQVFVLAGLWMYLRGRRMMLTAVDAGDERRGLSLAATGIVFGTGIGLLAKESSVLLPVYAFLAEAVILRFTRRNAWTEPLSRRERAARSAERVALGEGTELPIQTVIPGLAAASSRAEPGILSQPRDGNSEIPGSIADETGDGPGMTSERGMSGTGDGPGMTSERGMSGTGDGPGMTSERGMSGSGDGPGMTNGKSSEFEPSPGAARHPLPGGEGNEIGPSGHPLSGGEGKTAEPLPAPSGRPLRKWNGKTDKRIWALFVVVLFAPMVLGLAWLLPRVLRPGAWTGRTFTLGQRLLTEPRVLIDYIHWTLLPNPDTLSLYHDEIVTSTGWFTPWTTLLAIAAVLALIAIVVWLRNRRPLVALGIGWFFAAQLTSATVIPLELVYEHRNYFASIGVLLAVFSLLLGLRNRIRWPLVRGTIVALALLLFASVTYLRAKEWSDPLRLAIAEANRHPTSARANYEAGRLLIIATNYQPSPGLDKAWFFLRRAGAAHHASALAEQAMIMIADHGRHGDDAALWETMFRKLRTQPTSQEDISALVSLTNCYGSDICKFDRSNLERAYRAALSRPNPIARLLGAYAAFARDRLHDDALATQYLERAVKGAPSEPAYRMDLAKLYATHGRTELAVQQIDALRRMNAFGRLDRQIAVLEQLAERGGMPTRP